MSVLEVPSVMVVRVDRFIEPGGLAYFPPGANE
jgi:hypothetical protein